MLGEAYTYVDGLAVAGFELIRAPRSQLAIMAPGASTAGQLSLPSVALLRKLSVYTVSSGCRSFYNSKTSISAVHNACMHE